METVLTLIDKYGIGLVAFVFIFGFIFYVIRVFTKKTIEEAISAEFTKGIEDYKKKLQEELEELKTSLGKSETIFARQLEALTTLRRMFRGILPKKRFLEMEWSEACEDIARSFEKHANTLDEFLCLHSVALPTEVLQSIETAISIAEDGGFEFRWGNPAEPTDNAIDQADKFWEIVRSAVTSLQATVDAQIPRRKSPT